MFKNILSYLLKKNFVLLDCGMCASFKIHIAFPIGKLFYIVIVLLHMHILVPSRLLI